MTTLISAHENEHHATDRYKEKRSEPTNCWNMSARGSRYFKVFHKHFGNTHTKTNRTIGVVLPEMEP